jgi:uncharacterized pyridoxal phosphate-containing UPF0001 family protein
MATRVFSSLTVERVRANLAAVREEVDAAAGGRAVEVLAAVKYVPAEELGVLAEAGVTLVGENRAQELERKRALPGADAFAWDFIGQLQSRKVRQIAPLVRRIHSVASESALRELGRHAPPGLEVLVEVNVAEEDGKAGVEPDALGAFLERAAEGPYAVVGLMTMPPLAERAEDNRRWFAALRALADRHGLPELSMGTTQDFAVAVQEGATVVRIGTRLYA